MATTTPSFTAPTATASTWTPTTGTAQLFKPDNNKSTVQGQMTGLLSTDSPYVQVARTGAAQQANSRGLLNTSMAVTAGEDAAIRSALPIAQQDANTYNQIGQFNTSMINDMTKTNLTAKNAAGQFNAQQKGDISKVNAELTSRYDLAKIDSGTKLQMADIEAGYKTLLGANESAYNMYQQALKNITDISMSKDMTADAKQTGISNQLNLLKNGMSIIGTMDNLKLGDLLNFTSSAGKISSGGKTATTTASNLTAPSDWSSITTSTPTNGITAMLATAYNKYTASGGTLNANDWYRLIYNK